MFDELSRADQKQLFDSSVVMSNGNFVFVESIGENGYKLFDLKGQKTDLFPADVYKTFTPVYKRLGFVNLTDSVAFLARTTIRQYVVGYNSQNVRVLTDYIPGIAMMKGREGKLTINQLLKSKTFYESLLGEYPTLNKAWKIAEEFKHPVAFDKQFAINHDKTVVFKLMGVVGKYNLKTKVVDFIDGYEHLKLLLENPCGKDLRTLSKEERIW